MPVKTIYLPAGAEYVQFGEIAHLIANALYPPTSDDDERIEYGFARINLDDELLKEVKAGTLQVKDPLTFGPHSFPVGDALCRSLVPVSDLRAFLDGRPISLESAPAQNTTTPAPGFYTLEEAAQAIATNLGWHDGARDTLKNQLMQAARDGLLTVRHPHTDAPYRPDTVRDFYELVTPADVNAWAARGGVSWRWDVAATEPEAAPEPLVPPVVNASASGGAAWAVITPQRYHGYSSPLHRFLTAAHREGKPRPSARDALEEWRANMPAEIEKVLPDGIDYYDSKGDPKSADLEAIRKTIGRMTIVR